MKADGGRARPEGRVAAGRNRSLQPGAGPREGLRRRAPHRRDRGQSTVELALVLPFVVVLLLLLIQVGIIVRDQVLVTHAAREAVRSAAVGDAVGLVDRAASSSSGLDPGRLEVTSDDGLGGAGGTRVVTVRVTYRCVTEVPVIGILLPDVDLSADASMRRE